ncbi:hypothetical protein F7725_019236 [Dissostichus mawsoni]|uniref:Uncharacterized protein n=1 Tax=Dissostichus mawsoni TaxID=36200 RepID=A0A7J5YM78_DISMA|nr:hypothetical protein F7725_019236 [Dissostichus mawsoni]
MTSNQESSADIQETEFGSPALSKQRRIIYFSSGETMEEEDSEEEEEEEERSSDRTPFREPAEKSRLSFRNVALLVGRISLLSLTKLLLLLPKLACDFLGERLAGALGLKAAKYQYASTNITETTSGASEDLMEGGGRRSASPRERRGVITELRERSDARLVLRRDVIRNKRTRGKGVTTEHIKQRSFN